MTISTGEEETKNKQQDIVPREKLVMKNDDNIRDKTTQTCKEETRLENDYGFDRRRSET